MSFRRLPFFATILFSLASLAADPPSINIRRVVLDSGMVVILKEDHRAPVVSAQVWVRTGSIHEGAHLGAGLSHILEHMLFKGTPTRGVGQIAKEITAHGGGTNAYTSFDRTVFHIDIPVDGGQAGTQSGLNTALEILADAIQNSTLDEAEYAKEQQVILRELAMNLDNPDRRASLLLYSTAFTTHPYRHPVIGYEEVYRKLTRADAMNYYRERYAPNNIFFVVVGDIQFDAVETKIRGLFKNFQRQSVTPVYVPAEPPQTTPRRRDEELATLTQSRLKIAYHTVTAHHSDAPALDVLAIIAGDGRSSRFYRELRDKKALVQSVSVGSATLKEAGLFVISILADPDKRGSAEGAAMEELEKFSKQQVTEAELLKAIQKAAAEHLATRKTMSGQAEDLGSGELVADDFSFSDFYLQALLKVKREDVQRVAQKYFRPENLTVVSLNPPGTIRRSAPGTAKSAEPEIEKIELPNGLRVLLREDHRLPFVIFFALSKGGQLSETENSAGLTALMAKVMVKGTKTRTAEQIAEEMESVGGVLGSAGGANAFSVSAEVLSPNYFRGFDLWSDVLLNPIFPAEAVERERAAQLAQVRAQNEQIRTVADLWLRQSLFGPHPYHQDLLGTEASLKKLSAERIAEFYRLRCAPNATVVAIFGDFNREVVLKDVKERFGAWQTKASDLPKYPRPTLGKVERRTVAMPKEQAIVEIGFLGADLQSPDRDPLNVLREAISGMGNRLFARLRDELGLCYYTGASQVVGVDTGMFYFFVGTTPGKEQQCEVEIQKQISRLRDEPITAEELTRAQTALVGRFTLGLQNSGGLAEGSAFDELFGLGYNYYKTYPQRIQSVTAAQIQAAARKYFTETYAAIIVSREVKSEKKE